MRLGLEGIPYLSQRFLELEECELDGHVQIEEPVTPFGKQGEAKLKMKGLKHNLRSD
jgi:hypothetical protein